MRLLAVRMPSRSKFVTSIHSALGRWSAGTPHLSTKPAPLRSLVLLSVLFGLASSEARAQNATPGGPRNNFTRANGGGVMPGGNGSSRLSDMPPACRSGCFPIFWDDRETVVVEREIIREVPAAPPPPPEPPPPPRKPYVIGASYASLPGGCMKMVEAKGAYFYCSGEWYRQVGGGYKAVREP